MPNASLDPGAFSRRSFIMILVLAPASFLCIFAILVVMQYRQFRSIVSPSPDVIELRLGPAQEDSVRNWVEVFRQYRLGAGSGWKSDSLWLTPRDLDLLLAASPVARSQGLRFRVDLTDSAMLVHSTQPVEELQGRLAWIFKRLAKHQGYFNAAVLGLPKLGQGTLDLDVERGFINGQKVPAVALEKRNGMSPRDFLENPETFDRFLPVLSEVKLLHRKILLVRKK